jgi:hypothetical protein
MDLLAQLSSVSNLSLSRPHLFVYFEESSSYLLIKFLKGVFSELLVHSQWNLGNTFVYFLGIV